jgi:uncharacterized protein involved in exopolysaccharide biosynthesis
MAISHTYPDAYGTGADVTFLELWRALLAEWKLVTAIVVLGAALSVATALLLTPKYEAATVVVEKNNVSAASPTAQMLSKLGGLAQFAGIDLGTLAGGSSTAVATLESRALVEIFITKYDLVPVLYADEWDPQAKRWKASSPEDQPTTWKAVRLFMEHVLTVEEDPTKGLLTVRVEWTDPQVAARWSTDLVKLCDEIVRSHALAEAQHNVAYLNGEIARTTILGLQQVLYGLIQNEMQTMMLANDRDEYAFSVVDPAAVPEDESFPNRPLICVAGTIVAGFIALLVVLVRLVTRKQGLHANQA